MERKEVEAERLEKEEAEAKEKARQEALKPDKEKLIKFADELANINFPDVKSTESREILSMVRLRLDNLAIEINKQAKEL